MNLKKLCLTIMVVVSCMSFVGCSNDEKNEKQEIIIENETGKSEEDSSKEIDVLEEEIPTVEVEFEE